MGVAATGEQPSRPRRCTLLWRVPVGLLLVWLGGYAHFLFALPSVDAVPPTQTEAIVALTGGSNRIDVAVELLRDGYAPRLFISGVSHGASLRGVLGAEPEALGVRADQIDLDDVSTSTFMNAQQTAAWARAENVHSIRLVTSNYHMLRSMREMRAALPDVEIIPHPVEPTNLQNGRWLTNINLHWLLLGEYTKAILVGLRVGLFR